MFENHAWISKHCKWDLLIDICGVPQGSILGPDGMLQNKLTSEQSMIMWLKLCSHQWKDTLIDVCGVPQGFILGSLYYATGLWSPSRNFVTFQNHTWISGHGRLDLSNTVRFLLMGPPLFGSFRFLAAQSPRKYLKPSLVFMPWSIESHDSSFVCNVVYFIDTSNTLVIL